MRTHWFCPLYGKDIAEGKCFDINYERLGIFNTNSLDEVTNYTGKREPEITHTCETCPNFPLREMEKEDGNSESEDDS